MIFNIDSIHKGLNVDRQHIKIAYLFQLCFPDYCLQNRNNE
jgi:hypothetical protein